MRYHSKHANQIINIEQKKGQLATYIFVGDLNSTIETGIIKFCPWKY